MSGASWWLWDGPGRLIPAALPSGDLRHLRKETVHHVVGCSRNILDLGPVLVPGGLLLPLLAMLRVRPAPAARTVPTLTGLPQLWFNVRYPAKRREPAGDRMPDGNDLT